MFGAEETKMANNKKIESEILSLLPPKPEKKVFVQGHIAESLHQEVVALMGKDDITWPELLTATLTAYRNAHNSTARKKN
jgi:hypothetical protein